MTQPPTPSLPAAADEALRAMIEITASLRAVMEAESGHIAALNEGGILEAEDHKNELIAQYQQAVAEFRTRHAEFQGADAALLERLQSEQEALSLITRDNQHYLQS